MTLFLYKSLNLKHKESIKTNMMLNETYILRSYSDYMLHRNYKLDVCKHKSEQQYKKKRQTEIPLQRNSFHLILISDEPAAMLELQFS